MFKAPFEIRSIDVSRDDRGMLGELLRFADDQIPGSGQLYFVTINPGQRRGDHFHKIKHEWFVCLSGKIRVLVQSESTEATVIELNGENPEIVYCAPRTAHALENQSMEPAVVVSYGSIQHSNEDPDTYPKFITV